MATVRYTISLDAIKDAHIVRWLETQPNVSAAVRQALLHEIETVKLSDLEHKLDRVLDALRNVRVIKGTGAGTTEETQGEPAAAAAGLGAMLGKFKEL